ncbi:copper chaperone PCu(A)C [Kitasatospora sp. MBT63]|uniref:copper chaperone PCu(A)C n=1 Tax=Kitasatospora sp. MBT63 TaxID=1444768 RepID=UPI000B2CBE6C|nr:copper chaperone PCu(A)C [Kitasatospora sp. MBT63]
MSTAFRRNALLGAGLATALTAGAILVACGSGDAGGAGGSGAGGAVAAAGAAGSAAAAGAASGTGAGSGTGVGAGAGASKLVVSDPYIPLPALSGGMGAGYLTIRNEGEGTDQLVRVSSPAASSVTMHRSSDTTMEEVGSLPVPAHGSLELARGGNHLMIMGWQRPPAVGDELELDLTFAKSGTISVKVPVKPLTYRPGN